MTVRVAIVHDALVNTGGAERVVLSMCEAFPDAPVYTSVYLPDRTFAAFEAIGVRTTWLQHVVGSERLLKWMFPLLVLAFSTLRLPDVDVVLTSTTFAAKAVRIPGGARHVCYCHAPFRLAWTPQRYAIGASRATAALMAAVARPLRVWDAGVMSRVHRVATNCGNMRETLRTTYGLEARIIHPPIRCDDYPFAAGAGEYYLVVSRLMPYKRVDLAIAACKRLGRRLIVVGDGPARSRLESLAGPTIEFTGRVSDERLKACYRDCRALLFPGEEDFGLTPVEAQACGRPVIAYGRGGVLETVRDGETGLLFFEQTEDALADAICRFERLALSPHASRENALRFDVEVFKRELIAFVSGQPATGDTAAGSGGGRER